MRWIVLTCLLTVALTCMAFEADETHVERAAEEQLQREKRVAVEDVDFDEPAPRKTQKSKQRNFNARDASDNRHKMPVVLPPYGYQVFKAFEECMLYMEGLTVVILDVDSISTSHTAWYAYVGMNPEDTFGYDASYVKCPIVAADTTKSDLTMDFTIDLKLGADAAGVGGDKKPSFNVTGNLIVKLNLIERSGIDFIGANIQEINIKPLSDAMKSSAKFGTSGALRNTSTTNIRSYFGYNFGCDSTEALWFDVDSTNKYLVGIVFNNIQIQSYGLTNATRNAEEFKGLPYFSTKTIDCEPTFSAGSWMGIVVTLVLVTVLMFGYLMLNSVQTMDRFDDPKQKQIVINFKE